MRHEYFIQHSVTRTFKQLFQVTCIFLRLVEHRQNLGVSLMSYQLSSQKTYKQKNESPQTIVTAVTTMNKISIIIVHKYLFKCIHTLFRKKLIYLKICFSYIFLCNFKITFPKKNIFFSIFKVFFLKLTFSNTTIHFSFHILMQNIIRSVSIKFRKISSLIIRRCLNFR